MQPFRPAGLKDAIGIENGLARSVYGREHKKEQIIHTYFLGLITMITTNRPVKSSYGYLSYKQRLTG
jgi:hypothetical protein